MKTIRMTAIRTEKMRSRNHEKALHRLDRTRVAAAAISGVGAGTKLGLSFSCIPDLLRHYRRFDGGIGCQDGCKRRERPASLTRPSDADGEARTPTASRRERAAAAAE